MARVIGAVARSTNYEVTIRKPLDARSLVKTYEDLLEPSNWLNTAGNSIAYNGMLVAVANTSDISKNGIYFLFDINCTTSLKSPDVTLESNWLKIGENSDISDFVDRVAQIESELTSLSTQLGALKDQATEIFADSSVFPSKGIAGKLYIALDTEKTYIWVLDRYICVGDDTESYSMISGGKAIDAADI